MATTLSRVERTLQVSYVVASAPRIVAVRRTSDPKSAEPLLAGPHDAANVKAIMHETASAVARKMGLLRIDAPPVEAAYRTFHALAPDARLACRVRLRGVFDEIAVAR